MPEFGCRACYGDDPEASADPRHRKPSHRLIDESHFIVALSACTACGQQFVSIFSETVDWTDGDDPQYRSLVPVTPAETAELVGLGADVGEDRLGALGSGRRYVQSDWPGRGPRRVYWASGAFTVARHD